MDNSMDRHLNTSNRKLLQNFREVMEPKDTPSPVRYQAAAMKKRPPKGSLNRSKQKSRPSIGSRGGENLRTEVLHRRSEQSFMDQTLNVSVIQGINQTYANIAAPDSSESSFNSSIDLEKGARFRKQKKGKLETAPLPAEMKMTRPALKKKKKVAQSSSTSKEAGPRQKFITHNTVAQDTQDVEAQDKSKGFSTEAGIAKKTQSMPPEATSPQGAEHSLRTSANMDVSSISASSRRSDATYDFTADYDETLPNILDTKRKFRSKLSSRKLNLPSLIEALQAKQSSASPVTVSDILDTLNAPEVQVSSPDKGSQEPLEASDEESNESHSPATSGDDEAILPPLSFRDDEANRSTILRDTFFSDVDNTSRIRLHLEETDGDMNQNPLPKTPAPPEDEDMIVDLQKSASAAQGNGMSQVIDASPIKTPPRPSLGPITEVTPTKSSSSDMAQVNDPATSTGSPAQSSLKESKGQSIDDSSPRSLEDVGQVTDANTIRTPIRSSPRRSVGQASANKLSRSVGQVADAITTPIRSSPRRSVGQTSASKLSRSMGQVTDVITTPIRSSPRRSVGQVTDVITTPIRSSPRRSVGQASASRLSKNLGQVTDVIATPIRSSPRRSVGQVSASKSSRRSVGQVSASKSSRRSVGQVSASKSSRRSVGQVTDVTTTKTPTRSSPSRSVGQVSASKSSQRSVGQVTDVTTTKTPTRSSLSESVGQVTNVTTTKTPIRSSPSRSVGQVTDVTTTKTPTRSSPRKIVGQASANKSSRRSVGQVTDVTTKTPTRSLPRKIVGHASASKSSRRSVGWVTDVTATKTPTRSSLSGSVGHVTDATTTRTPIRSSPRGNMGQASASKSSQRSVGQVTDVTTTKTPTRSSLSGSVGQVTDATTTRTLTRSSLSGSVGQVTDVTTTKAPTESSPSGSVGQVTDVTTTKTPTRISPRQGLKRNLGSVLVSPQKGSVEDNTVMDVSLGRSRNAEARHRDTTPIISEATPAEEGDESEEEENPKKRTRTSQSLPEDDEHSSFSDFENEYSLIPITARTPPRYRRDIHEGYEVRDEEVETSPLTIEASPPPPPPPETPIKEQPSTSASTAKVRQMTMREFLEQLKKKPVQPPLTRPTPLLPSLLGTAPSSSQLKPRGRPKGKTRRKKQLPASVSKRLTKEIFTQFAKCRVSKRALDEVVKITEIFWENLVDDVCAMQTTKKHPTKSIQPEDVEKLMKRQGLITSKESLEVLVEQLLPMEMWSFFKTFPEPAHNPFPSFTGPFYET
ncbi:serine-rich adhesin for platelets-like isoform X10 [Eriocheir sinensis]|uniref:serine-rich adhesin for platelets-like isoform X10 n=1 Tax=Eriocheir sinensis TaxID=95602 RepID=UPI0021C91B44|nr:serine-rich adhesin for platelets-like isoform X10 [Eriocheir sinensis]